MSDLAAINLGAPTGDVGAGDVVICRGQYATVIRVIALPPGHGRPGIRDDMTCVNVETTLGERMLGAHRAWIGADLRMHWTR